MLQELLSDKVTISRTCLLPDLLLQKTIYEDGCELPRHAHEEPRFVVVLQGTFSEVSENLSKRICRPSTLLFRPAGQIHSNQFQNGRVACISIRLGPSWLDRFLESSIDWRKPLSCEGYPVSRLALELHRELYQPDSASRLAIEALVLELGVQTQRLQHSLKPRKTSDWVEKALQVIHDRFLEPMTVKTLAGTVAVHPVHLVRTFRLHYGCTPAEYIRKLRIRYACDLILSTDQSLVDVAQTTGFCDQSHFSRLFKRYVGTSPARFRKDRKSRA